MIKSHVREVIKHMISDNHGVVYTTSSEKSLILDLCYLVQLNTIIIVYNAKDMVHFTHHALSPKHATPKKQ